MAGCSTRSWTLFATMVAGLAVAPAARAETQPPVDIVFKIHIEPQADGRGNPPLEQRRAAWRRRRDDVEVVRAIAEAHGAKLSIHGNGEFWEFAAEEAGGADLVRSWLAAGHHVGLHMHAVYRRGAHDWPSLPRGEQTPERLAALWQDHADALTALIGPDPTEAATPFNFDGTDFDRLMQAFGFSIVGGGRHEIAYRWLGHPPFNPWRPGREALEEDLANHDYLIVFHTAQIGEADTHGPDAVFHDQRPAHLKVDFLQLLTEREQQARTGGEKRWLFGFLTHDNKSGADHRAEIEELLAWLDPFVAAGVARYASFDEVAAGFEDWERRHPGQSSFDYREGDGYPYSFPALADALMVTETQAVDLVGRLDAGPGATAWHLSRGVRGAANEDLVLAWSTTGAVITVDLAAVLGPTALLIDASTGVETVVDAHAVPIGPAPSLAR